MYHAIIFLDIFATDLQSIIIRRSQKAKYLSSSMVMFISLKIYSVSFVSPVMVGYYHS